MEIKILVPENRESDLDNFIKDCEKKGFELQNRGGGHIPNFSGYYATLKGSHWGPIQSEIPDTTDQLKADKEELLEVLQDIQDELENGDTPKVYKIEELIQKMKQ